MSKKQFILAIVFLFIIVGLGIVALKKRAKSWEIASSTSRTELFKNLDVNIIKKVKIAKDKEAVTLEKKEDKWVVNECHGYPADYDKLSQGILNLKHLKAAQEIKAGKSQYSRLQLVKPGNDKASGTMVDLYDNNDDKLAAVLLGKVHMAKAEQVNPMFGGPKPDGRYILLEDRGRKPMLVSQPFTEFTATPVSWLNKDFLKIEKIKALVLQTQDPRENWVLNRETEKGNFTLQGLEPGRELESGKVATIANGFKYFSFNNVLPADTKPAETGMAKADILKVITFDNFSYTMKIGKKGNKCFMQLTDVSCDIPKAREAKEGEKPAEKTKLDQQFEANKAKLKERLAKEKFFTNWIYDVPNAKFETLIIPRSELLKAKNVKVQKGQIKDNSSNTVQAVAPKD